MAFWRRSKEGNIDRLIDQLVDKLEENGKIIEELKAKVRKLDAYHRISVKYISKLESKNEELSLELQEEKIKTQKLEEWPFNQPPGKYCRALTAFGPCYGADCGMKHPSDTPVKQCPYYHVIALGGDFPPRSPNSQI